MRKAVAAILCLICTPASAEDITVFAAASLKTALDRIAATYQTTTGHTVRLSYGGSPVLAKQIAQGAPADIYLPASAEWMDWLSDAGLVQTESRIDLLGNRLVLLAHGTATPTAITPDLDLIGLLAGGKLAMALVDSVPAGQYGKQALQTLGLWRVAEAHVVQSENVRAALHLVTSGEAALGIVYASDAVADDLAGDRATVIGLFPADSHAPILYPAALLTGASPAAAAFLRSLASPQAAVVFAENGFVPLSR